MIRLLLILISISIPLYGMEISNVTMKGVSFKKPIVSFGICADMHYDNLKEPVDADDNLKYLIANCWNNNVDFIISLGDLIDGGSSEGDSLIDLGLMENILKTFNGSAYEVIGNHEWVIRNSIIANSILITSKYYSFDKNGVHFICLNSSHSAYATMGATQLAWLQADLEASDLPTIVFMHYRIDQDYPGDPPLWDRIEDELSYFMRDSAECRALLEEDGDVLAVFNGHWHTDRFEMVNGIAHVTIARGRYDKSGATISVYNNGEMYMGGFYASKTRKLR